MQLTRHENKTFSDAMIYLAGHAYINCRFERCTLFLRNTSALLDRCTFENCNWHFDYDVLWSEPQTLANLRGVLELIHRGSVGSFSMEKPN